MTSSLFVIVRTSCSFFLFILLLLTACCKDAWQIQLEFHAPGVNFADVHYTIDNQPQKSFRMTEENEYARPGELFTLLGRKSS